METVTKSRVHVLTVVCVHECKKLLDKSDLKDAGEISALLDILVSAVENMSEEEILTKITNETSKYWEEFPKMEKNPETVGPLTYRMCRMFGLEDLGYGENSALFTLLNGSLDASAQNALRKNITSIAEETVLRIHLLRKPAQVYSEEKKAFHHAYKVQFLPTFNLRANARVLGIEDKLVFTRDQNKLHQECLLCVDKCEAVLASNRKGSAMATSTIGMVRGAIAKYSEREIIEAVFKGTQGTWREIADATKGKPDVGPLIYRFVGMFQLAFFDPSTDVVLKQLLLTDLNADAKWDLLLCCKKIITTTVLAVHRLRDPVESTQNDTTERKYQVAYLKELKVLPIAKMFGIEHELVFPRVVKKMKM